MNDKTNGNGRIEALLEKRKQLDAVLAAERLKTQRRKEQDAAKLEAIIGAAVQKTGADSPDFRLMIAQTALINVPEKDRAFLADRGWLEQGR